jgi:hypothetical protein
MRDDGDDDGDDDDDDDDDDCSAGFPNKKWINLERDRILPEMRIKILPLRRIGGVN